MERKICIVVLLLILTLTPQPTSAQGDPASEIVARINDFRATLGLPPFTYNSQLAVAAQTQATYMSETNIYSHTGYGGSRPYDRAVNAGYSGRVSENIVGGGRMTPTQGLVWWQNSPVHYNTITSATYTEIGGGFAQGFDQNFYAIVVGLPSSAPAAEVLAETNSAETQLAAPIIVTPIPLSGPREDGSIVHTVAAGQALWTLAAYYDVAVDYLLRINNLTENDFVQPGDDVLIKLADGQPTPTPLPTATPPYAHVVSEGQNLWSIAAFYDLDLPTLLYLNSITEDAAIWPGQELTVRLRPGESPPPTATPQLTHVVREGDTLWTIAVWYGLTVEELLLYNNLQENSFIQPGSELNVRAPLATAGEVAAPESTPTSDAVAEALPLATTAAIDLSPTPNPSRQAELLAPTETVVVAAVSAETNPIATPIPTPEVAANAVQAANNGIDTIVQNLMIMAAVGMLVAAYFVHQLGRQPRDE